MIFEGSCDTEHWSNDAENSALHNRNNLHFKIYQINAALESIRDIILDYVARVFLL